MVEVRLGQDVQDATAERNGVAKTVPRVVRIQPELQFPEGSALAEGLDDCSGDPVMRQLVRPSVELVQY